VFNKKIPKKKRHVMQNLLLPMSVSGDLGLMSTRSAMQTMSHSSVYGVLRAEAVKALKRVDGVAMYSVVPVGKEKGFVATRLDASVCKPFLDSLLDPEDSDEPLPMLAPGITVQERGDSGTLFIPSLGSTPEEDGAEFHFFWFGGEGLPPSRMVTLSGSRCPVPFVRLPVSSRKDSLKIISVAGRSPLVDLFIEHVAAAFEFRHRCWKCQRPVSGRNKCAKCRAATYCDEECQRGDWRRHKGEDCLVVVCHNSTTTSPPSVP